MPPPPKKKNTKNYFLGTFLSVCCIQIEKKTSFKLKKIYVQGKYLNLMLGEHHYIFIISQLRLTSHPRSTVVLLDTGTLGTSREIYSEDAEGEARTRNPWITNPVL